MPQTKPPKGGFVFSGIEPRSAADAASRQTEQYSMTSSFVATCDGNNACIADQSSNRCLIKIENMLKPAWPTIVRIGNFASWQTLCPGHEQLQFSYLLRPNEFRQVAPMLMVNCQNQVQTLEVRNLDLSGAQVRQVVTSTRGMPNRSRVRSAADVIVVRNGRVHQYPVPKTLLGHPFQHDTFSGWRPANISSADKQH